MKLVARAVALGVLLLAPWGALAQNAALVLVENDYRDLPDLDAPAGDALVKTLESRGFRVVAAVDPDAATAARAMEDFRNLASTAQKVFVLVSGHVVSTPRDSWMLTRNADMPGDISIGLQAVPLGPLFDVAAAHPGQAVMMVGPAEGAVTGAGLVAGLPTVAPEGVTLVTGPVPALFRAARTSVLVPGLGVSALPRAVTVSGFASAAQPFLPPPPVTAGADRETVFWDVVKSVGTADAFGAYLRAYPSGRYAPLARAAMRELEGAASPTPQAAENALGLGTGARRNIQRDLSLLGFDPRGIDGIFGPGTRAALTAWQKASGYSATGYLTATEVRALSDAADVRAAELEREAAARKAQEEQRDTAYWRDTGRGGDETGLRAYLERYPDGLYSDIATARLTEIENSKRAAAAAAERAEWDKVTAKDTVKAYRGYLSRHPDGAFAGEAQARIKALGEEKNDAAAMAEEERVVSNNMTAILVENRLAAAGFDPGPVDGKFTAATRKALRRFQRAAGIEASGYVTRETMVRLLSVR